MKNNRIILFIFFFVQIQIFYSFATNNFSSTQRDLSISRNLAMRCDVHVYLIYYMYILIYWEKREN